MDDKEVFRLFFENDWNVTGLVKFVYDSDPKNVYEEVMEGGDIFCHPREFVFEKTKPGKGRLLEVKFYRNSIEGEEEEPEPFEVQFMLINNDYLMDGRVVTYGHNEGDGVVAGKQTNPALDPDNHT